MKNLLFPLKEHIIEWLILIMALIILTATIFSAVVILNPELFPKFPLVRETVISLSTATLVFVTLILALGTFVIIRHDRERENRDRKDQLLNEIINWSIDIRKITVAKDIQLPSKLGKYDFEMFKLSMTVKASSECDIARIKGSYIKNIVSSLWKELIPDVNRLIRQITHFDEIIKEEGKDISSVDTTEIQELNKYSEIVLKKATKIKNSILYS